MSQGKAVGFWRSLMIGVSLPSWRRSLNQRFLAWLDESLKTMEAPLIMAVLCILIALCVATAKSTLPAAGAAGRLAYCQAVGCALSEPAAWVELGGAEREALKAIPGRGAGALAAAAAEGAAGKDGSSVALVDKSALDDARKEVAGLLLKSKQEVEEGQLDQAEDFLLAVEMVRGMKKGLGAQEAFDAARSQTSKAKPVQKALPNGDLRKLSLALDGALVKDVAGWESLKALSPWGVWRDHSSFAKGEGGARKDFWIFFFYGIFTVAIFGALAAACYSAACVIEKANEDASGAIEIENEKRLLGRAAQKGKKGKGSPSL